MAKPALMREWRIIPSYPAYEASSDGLVRRRAPYDRAPNIGRSVKPLTPRFWSRYHHVTITLGSRDMGNKRFRRVKVARLVCEAFHGSAPTAKHHALHRNGKALDDRAANLTWGTAKENTDTRTRNGMTSRGAKHSKAVRLGKMRRKN